MNNKNDQLCLSSKNLYVSVFFFPDTFYGSHRLVIVIV
uniref:Uncharacterized protein n=1 Tax=Arundo donax TaxID=35708 RepID=A0A0A9GZG0_ARUDO